MAVSKSHSLTVSGEPQLGEAAEVRRPAASSWRGGEFLGALFTSQVRSFLEGEHDVLVAGPRRADLLRGPRECGGVEPRRLLVGSAGGGGVSALAPVVLV